MKLIPITTFAVSLLFLQGCGTSKAPLPSFKITAHKAIVLPSGGGKVLVEGAGATPGKNVVIQLVRLDRDLTLPPETLGSVKAGPTGLFSYNNSQGCIFPAGRGGSSVWYVAIDQDTGRSARTSNLDRGFLECL